MNGFVYLNGALVDARQAKVSVFDAGLTHTAGLFETLRAYNGRVMRLEDHLERLSNSADTLEMQIALDRQEIKKAVDDLLAANGLEEARLRIVMTPGPVNLPGRDPADPGTPTTLIFAGPVLAYPRELYEHGMRVCICPYQQSRLDPLAGHKTLAYFPRLLAIRKASEKKCHEALWFTTEHLLAEGSVCNVFIVKDDVLATPPLETPILPGIVRKAVIELASANGIRTEQRPIDIDMLLSASEVFLTGSVLEIMPVTAIEKHQVGSGVPGEITKRVRRLYADLVCEECGVEG